MRAPPLLQKIVLIVLSLALIAGGTPGLIAGQAPPASSPAELDKLVSRIALYPDPLLAQILAAATYPDQIPDAAKWADEHHYLTGDDLARAITEDHLPWDPSVQALLPFPSVLEMMASDMDWTTQHHYDAFHRWTGPRGVEHHELIPRDEAERKAARLGHARVPEVHHSAPVHH
jgi:Protein of unknown function (DUF3300)